MNGFNMFKNVMKNIEKVKKGYFKTKNRVLQQISAFSTRVEKDQKK